MRRKILRNFIYLVLIFIIFYAFSNYKIYVYYNLIEKSVSINKSILKFYLFSITSIVALIFILLFYISKHLYTINKIYNFLINVYNDDYTTHVKIKDKDELSQLYKKAASYAKRSLNSHSLLYKFPINFVLLDNMNYVKFASEKLLKTLNIKRENIIRKDFFNILDVNIEEFKEKGNAIIKSSSGIELNYNYKKIQIIDFLGHIIGDLIIFQDIYVEVVKDRVETVKKNITKKELQSYSNQIKKMERVINDVSDGNMSNRIIIKEDDELKELYEKVNSMIEKLQYDFIKIHKAKQELENKNVELDRKNLELQEMDKLKTSFLSTLSHELNTPLTYILSYSDMIPNFLNNKEKVTSVMQKIKLNTLDLINMNSTVIEFAKLQSNSLEFHFSLYNVNLLVHEMEYDFDKELKNKNIKLEFLIDSKLKNCYIDKDKLSKAFKQIVDNAIKISENDSKIIIKTENKDSDVLISFIDNGPGISEESGKILFDDFRQLEDYSTRKYSGLGIGLSYCKKIIDKHDGNIWFENNKEKGVTFFIALNTKKRV